LPSGQKKKHAEPQAAARTEPLTPQTPPPTTGNADAEGLVESVRAIRPMVAAFLEQAASVDWSGNRLTIAYDAGGAALKKQLEQKESLELLRTSAERLAGKSIEVQVVSVDAGGGPETPVTPAPETTARSAATPPPRKPQRKSAPPRQRRRTTEQGRLIDEARRNPGVAKLLDSFGAQVVEIVPLELPADTPGDPES
jgi:hypothetical protein